MAVGSRSSDGVILKGPISPMNRVLQEGIGNTVKIESLDHIINELQITEINLLMMDIQGYEYFALQGLQSSLSAKIIKNLICEIHPLELSENGLTDNNVIDLLSRHRYEVCTLQKNTSDNSVYYIHAT